MVAVSRLAIDRRFSCRSPGTLPTDAIQFVLLIVRTVLNLGTLTFLPALTLGPSQSIIPATSCVDFVGVARV